MPNDIRLEIGFPLNPKTRRLVRALGDSGLASIVRLWCYVGEHFPKGEMKNIAPEEIEDFAGWAGERGAFVEYTLRNNWVHNENGAYSVHDWEKHQPWVFHQDKRSEMARNAVNARWEKRKGKQKLNTERIRNEYATNTESNTPLPTPSPSPSPKTYAHDALTLYEYYSKNVVNVPAKKRDALRNIAKRIQEGHSCQQLGKAIAKYADECDEQKTEKRYHANNFFGQKAYFEAYLPDKPTEGDST